MHSISSGCREREALLEAPIAPDHFARALVEEPGHMDTRAHVMEWVPQRPQSRFLVPEGLAGGVLEPVRRHDAKVREGLAGLVRVRRAVVVEASHGCIRVEVPHHTDVAQVYRTVGHRIFFLLSRMRLFALFSAWIPCLVQCCGVVAALSTGTRANQARNAERDAIGMS